MGMGVYSIIVRISVRIGVVKNKIGEVIDGWMGFLIKSFMLLVIGCNSFWGFIIFGFFWSCI